MLSDHDVLNRRDFVKRTGGAASAVGLTLLHSSPLRSANDRIQVGVIGVGGSGGSQR
jgi:hypothetical protein